jgi:hypothetical protein
MYRPIVLTLAVWAWHTDRLAALKVQLRRAEADIENALAETELITRHQDYDRYACSVCPCVRVCVCSVGGAHAERRMMTNARSSTMPFKFVLC